MVVNQLLIQAVVVLEVQVVVVMVAHRVAIRRSLVMMQLPTQAVVEVVHRITIARKDLVVLVVQA